MKRILAGLLALAALLALCACGNAAPDGAFFLPSPSPSTKKCPKPLALGTFLCCTSAVRIPAETVPAHTQPLRWPEPLRTRRRDRLPHGGGLSG